MRRGNCGRSAEEFLIAIRFPQLSSRDALSEGRLVRMLPAWSGREATLHLVFASRHGLLPGVRVTIDFAAQTLDPKSCAWHPEG